jgi:hypothetical protein
MLYNSVIDRVRHSHVCSSNHQGSIDTGNYGNHPSLTRLVPTLGFYLQLLLPWIDGATFTSAFWVIVSNL